MAALTALLSLGMCLCAGSITTAEELSVPRAEKLRWISLDFKTVLTWTTQPSEHTYTVLFAPDDGDWTESHDCIEITDTECDLTHDLQPLNRAYSADIQTNTGGFAYDEDEQAHTYSSLFNPYRESNISAVRFAVRPVNESTVTINITDTLTAIHEGTKQLTIRDVLRSDLKYKITYYKAGSTGKREVISASSVAEVSKLDAGEEYCFIVAAFVPSRPKEAQHGGWSSQQCTQVQGTAQGLSLGALVGVIFIVITVLIISIVVAVLCCNCCRQRNKSFQTAQTTVQIPI
ncbi:tissue factor-like isoform X2 [Salarias fasciatus]|uniref:Tissue factor n=1 Tax=Salarias fasciatus TaxID=181472 RepID=A0A672HSW4_SALFA|nr:tissue factor-like isoform X2 [Salarias fasciatus]